MKIAILGYGKMGKAIERIALASGHEIVLKVDEFNRQNVLDGQLQKADVAIEFTAPGVAIENYRWCFQNHIPVVSGTTGWLSRYNEVVQQCQEMGGGFFYASNFSIGVNIFFHVNRCLAKVMARFEDYKVLVEETHHVHKLDAPSGTAISLANAILEENSYYSSWQLDEGNDVDPCQIPILAKREGEVAGIHMVTYKSGVDEIQIRHAAFSRDGFAQGAVWAAEFMKNKVGIYGMKDLLNFVD